MAHSGIDGVCRCPRCIGCKTLLSADRVCLNCAPEPDEVWGLGGSLPDPAQAAELAQFPPGAPERYAPARYLTAPPRHGAEREPNSQTKEDDLVPTPLIAEAGSRGYRAMPVDITAVGIWTGVITIEAPTATGRSRGAVRRFYSDSTNRIRAALSASPSAKKPHSPSCATSPPPCGSSALPGTSATATPCYIHRSSARTTQRRPHQREDHHAPNTTDIHTECRAPSRFALADSTTRCLSATLTHRLRAQDHPNPARRATRNNDRARPALEVSDAEQRSRAQRSR